MTVSLPQLLTNSRLTAKKKCARLHFNRYELGVRPDEDAVPLRIGGAFHLGAELREKGAPESDAIRDAVASYGTLPAWANTDEGYHKWMVEAEVVMAMLSAYFWRWSGDADQVAEILAVEVPFRIPIRNPETGRATSNFEYAGKIDGIVKLKDGRIAVRERKTTGEDIEPGSDYWSRLRIDHQISGYIVGARALGYPASTVLYDVAKRPTIKPSQVPLLDESGTKIVLDSSGQRVKTKDGKKWRESGDTAQGYVLQSRIETPQEFGKRVLDEYTADPDRFFRREEIPRLDSDIDEFLWELWQQQQELREAQKTGRWYRNTTACVQRNSKCEYADLCWNGITIDPDNPPTGFVRVADVHPELAS